MGDNKFPGWRYDPATAEGRLFNRAEDVPSGWVDRLNTEPADAPEPPPAKVPDAPEPPATVPGARPAITKAEIVEALTAGQIEFKKNTSAAALLALLTENVHAALTARNMEFDPHADVRDLLAALTS